MARRLLSDWSTADSNQTLTGSHCWQQSGSTEQTLTGAAWLINTGQRMWLPGCFQIVTNRARLCITFNNGTRIFTSTLYYTCHVGSTLYILDAVSIHPRLALWGSTCTPGWLSLDYLLIAYSPTHWEWYSTSLRLFVTHRLLLHKIWCSTNKTRLIFLVKLLTLHPHNVYSLNHKYDIQGRSLSQYQYQFTLGLRTPS